VVLGGAVLGVAATGWLDYASGGELGLSLVYLMVVCAVTWHSSLRWGSLTAGLAWLAWTAALVPFVAAHQVTVESVNSASRFILFLVAAYLVNRLRVAQSHLFEVNRRLAAALERESSLARTDILTGLYNRRGFVELAERDVERSKRQLEPLAIAFLDLDQFKALNDSRGHEEGDRCLRAVSATIRAVIRKTDLAGRLGGDEFALLMSATSADASERVCARVLEGLTTMLAEFDCPGLGASVGLVTFDIAPEDVTELLDQADRAMYAAKAAGKGRVHRVPGSTPPKRPSPLAPNAGHQVDLAVPHRGEPNDR
jgi:diguanylate cyclase (GGDEF)-like protein